MISVTTTQLSRCSRNTATENTQVNGHGSVPKKHYNRDGRGVWGRMHTCICMDESIYCPLETITTLLIGYQFSSVAQSCPTLCDPWTQHTRPPCPSPTPGVHSGSRPSSRWCHPAFSSSVGYSQIQNKKFKKNFICKKQAHRSQNL